MATDKQDGGGGRFPGFSRPTYTVVPDELFDDLLAELSGAELKVLLYIIRRTFGFKKDSDNISLRQMAEGIRTRDGRVLDRGAGVGKSTAALAVRALEEKGYIVHQLNRSPERGDEPTTYALRFRDGPVSKNWTGGYPEIGQARVQELDTQETVEQETVTSKAHARDESCSSVRDTSKFRKGSRPVVQEDAQGTAAASRPSLAPPERLAPTPQPALGSPTAERGMRRISEVLRDKGIAARPAATSTNGRAPHASHPTGGEGSAEDAPPNWSNPGTPRSKPLARLAAAPDLSAGAADEPAPSQSAHHSVSRATAEERQSIQAYLGDFAPELGDQAPFKSSVSRVANIFVDSGLTMGAFVQRLYAARSRTKERYTSIRDRSKRFAYFCALLEEECGLREPPVEIAAAAKARAPQADASPPPVRKSLAGKYAKYVRS